jgi:hypothetical protein
MNKRSLHLTVAFLVASLLLVPSVLASTIQYDKTASVTSIIDGSTFTINTGETIKLAEIITPSTGQAGYESSKDYLAAMIQGKTVFLDVDTRVVTDQGKFLCVAYLDFNSSHYENINQAMIENHYAIANTTSTTEFNPATWAWFIAKETATTSPTATIPATASPTPTPFSGVTPSVSIDVSPQTENPIPTTNNTNAPFQTWIIIIVVVLAILLLIGIIIKIKRK